jgi:tagaturonate reductase
METPILQFGTSRFLQAHCDLFVSEALRRGEALGRITVVQTTRSPGSHARVEAFNRLASFPVLIRGLEGGAVVDRRVDVDSVARAFDANESWKAVEDIFVREAVAVVSNTGDRGYERDAADQPDGAVPRSFPAKLTKLLAARFRHRGEPFDLFPCELITGNGAVLRDLVLDIARDWRLDGAFAAWVGERCRWHSSLVDRIVSEALEPIGAVAEPYALWAIQAMPGLDAVCKHPAVVVTEDLQRYERLKLYILNLGHTFLAERWLLDRRPPEETVREALADATLRRALDALYEQEVLPVFAALGMGEEAKRYRYTVIERFSNPFLKHRLADIAQNHEAKKRRRFAPVIELAQRLALCVPLTGLSAALISGATDLRANCRDPSRRNSA